MQGLVSSLFEVRDFYEREVLQDVQFKRPADGDRLDAYELVRPKAHVGWIPPGGVLAPSRTLTIPCIVVGLDRRTASTEDTEMGVRITAAIYDPGHQTWTEESSLSTDPNFEGYVTLVNLMDRLEAVTMKHQVIGGRYKLDSAIESKMYDEQPWPYWYGYLRFTLSGPPDPVTRYAGLL